MTQSEFYDTRAVFSGGARNSGCVTAPAGPAGFETGWAFSFRAPVPKVCLSFPTGTGPGRLVRERVSFWQWSAPARARTGATIPPGIHCHSFWQCGEPARAPMAAVPRHRMRCQSFSPPVGFRRPASIMRPVRAYPFNGETSPAAYLPRAPFLTVIGSATCGRLRRHMSVVARSTIATPAAGSAPAGFRRTRPAPERSCHWKSSAPKAPKKA